MRVVAAYVLMCLIWGTTWLGIKIGLHSLGPILGVGLRFIIAGLALYAAAATTGKLRPLPELPWRLVAVLSVFLFGLNYVLTYAAETHLDSGLVAVLFGTLPFFTFAFAHAMVGERTTPRVWIGALAAFAGVGVISLAHRAVASPLFACAAIAAAASSAFANVYAKRHAHHDPLVTLPPSMLLAGIALAIAGLLIEHTDWHAALSSTSLGALFYLAIFGSGIAFFANMWVLARIPVWVVGMSALIIPVIAVTVGIVFGGEHFTLREALGSLLVAGGIAIALTGAETRLKRSDSSSAVPSTNR